jgi:CrcB protein
MTVYIFIGGGLGAILRHLLSQTLNHRAMDLWFQGIPLGTLSANLIGSFLLGFIVGALPTSTPIKSGLTTGLMGGLTTFSTLSLESAKLWESGQSLRALLHLTLHLSGGILLAIVGLSLGVILGRKT